MRKDHQLAVELVKLIFPSAAIQLKGEEFNWHSMTIVTDNTRLVLTSKVEARRQTEFARITATTLSYFQKVSTRHQANKDWVLSVLQSCKMVIGVAAHPGFDQKVGHYECIFSLTRGLGGLIFNGFSVLDEAGNVVLAPVSRPRMPYAGHSR